MTFSDAHFGDLLLQPTASRVARSINCPLDMSRNAVLARVELRSDDAVLAKGSANCLADLSNSTIRVKLLADCASRRDD
jgi:hypothetical protein